MCFSYWFFIHTDQKQPPEMFCKKAVLRDFAKFTGKHLYQKCDFQKIPLQLY